MVRKLGIALAAILFLFIIAALILPTFLQSDQLKGHVVAEVQKLTGRELVIGGNLRLRILPSTGIYMENVTLSGPEGFDKKKPFLSLKALDVGIEPLRYLTEKEIVITKFKLEEPAIALMVNEKGAKNWEIAFDKNTQPAPAKDTKEQSSKPASLSALILSGAELNNGTISYTNAMSKENWKIEHVNADLALKGGAKTISFNGSADWNGKPVTVTVQLGSWNEILRGQSTGLEATVKSALIAAEIKGTLENVSVMRGKLNLTSSSLRECIGWAMPAGKPLAVATPLETSINGDFACSSQSCAISKAALRIDKLEAKGDVKANYGAGRAVPEIDMVLTTPALDINPFLSSQPENAKQEAATSNETVAASGWSDEPINVSALRNFNMNADIQADSITYRKLHIGKATLRAKLQRARLSADVVNAELYNGKGNMSFTLDGTGDMPSMTGRFMLSGINLAELLKDTADMDKLSGNGDVNLNISSRGRNQKAFISALAGNAQFKITNGAFKGANFVDLMQTAQSVLAPVAQNPAKFTEFSELSGSALINDGIATNKDLLFVSSVLRAHGEGQVDLPQRRIHYRLTPEMALKGADGTVKQGLSVPVVIEGSFDQLTFHPDAGSLVEQAIKDPKKLKEQLGNTRDAVKEQLKNPKDAVKNIKGLLKGL